VSQTGEFGLLACSLAYQLKIIEYDFFKAALAVIGFSLLVSSIWMTVRRKHIYLSTANLLLFAKNNGPSFSWNRYVSIPSPALAGSGIEV
jgi:hypothetical protein